jgi:hypothetical protein
MPALDLRRLADVNNDESFSNRMRSERFRLFETLTEHLPRPLRIIDIGGTNEFWEQRGWAERDDVHITLVNLFAGEQLHDNIVPIVGDATNLADHADGAYDIAFSNSVIEHLFTFEAQQKMAAEMRRVALRHWVQTPNYWFPIDPHFLMPGWQYLPRGARVEILRRRRVGWRGPLPDRTAAREAVEEIRLMTGAELRKLFPDSEVRPEKWHGVTKSWIVLGGLGR